ncbi:MULTISPECIES: iron chelate uptake ABC transporter family permease subunit [Microbacterium]|uniref:iron chelate uptake ABC transporter family permease subunit n=1 Tax=Microbacterium TaxID=33882 RepID=UPI00217E4C12|nr:MULTISPECIES: iron chelate uptake ABC transporter family permease subunit [Microbacterium]
MTVAVGVLAVVSAATGSVPVSPREAAQLVVGHVLPGMPWMSDGSLSPLQDQAVWHFRLPRALLAGLAGAGLALAGALMQVTVRNPLAEPYVLGVSSGAGVGAVTVIVLGSATLGGLSLNVAAFAGALTACVAVARPSASPRSSTVHRLCTRPPARTVRLVRPRPGSSSTVWGSPTTIPDASSTTSLCTSGRERPWRWWGPSGAGKTTAARLALRLWDPDTGSVRIDGTDLRDIPDDELRRLVSAVPQSSPLQRGTIRSNITLGDPEACDTVIRATAGAAGLLDPGIGLPEGLDTPIGEHGTGLSGGQRARVAIARALLNDPRVLILDEPTASLDPAADAVVMEFLNRSQDRAVLLIAHRPETIATADRIVRLAAADTEASSPARPNFRLLMNMSTNSCLC